MDDILRIHDEQRSKIESLYMSPIYIAYKLLSKEWPEWSMEISDDRIIVWNSEYEISDENKVMKEIHRLLLVQVSYNNRDGLLSIRGDINLLKSIFNDMIICDKLFSNNKKVLHT